MSDQPVQVTNVSWRDLCPWTIIFRSLQSATSMTVITLALLGLVLMPIGWIISDKVFLNDDLRLDADLATLIRANRSPYERVFLATDPDANAIHLLGQRLSGPRMVFLQFVEPFRQMFSIPPHFTGPGGDAIESPRWSSRVFFYLLAGCTWTIFLWSFLGTGICRVALLKLTRNEPAGIDDAFEFASEKFLAAAGAVGIPLLGIAAICIPMFLVGLFMGLDVGVLLVGLLWFVVLMISAAVAILLLGLMFGWPLMIASVACEGQNSFDAMTRSYAYVFQRPLNVLLYCLISMAFGGFCWFVVATLTDGALGLSYWSTSFGTRMMDSEQVDRIDVIRGVAAPLAMNEGKLEAIEPSSALRGGQTMIRVWSWLARSVAAAFIYGLFWCMASAVYLLLRKDVDDTEMDEIFLVDERRSYELPPLKTDDKGIPQVQKPVPLEEPESESSS